MTTTRDTANWKDKIEVAIGKLEEVISTANEAKEELWGLGDLIEGEGDSLISCLADAEKERDEFGNERDILQAQLDALSRTYTK